MKRLAALSPTADFPTFGEIKWVDDPEWTSQRSPQEEKTIIAQQEILNQGEIEDTKIPSVDREEGTKFWHFMKSLQNPSIQAKKL